MKKVALALTLLLLVTGSALAAYPEKNLQGYIMWGAGGAMDNVTRAIVPIAQEHLGKTIILQNRTGATGAMVCVEASATGTSGVSAGIYVRVSE